MNTSRTRSWTLLLAASVAAPLASAAAQNTYPEIEPNGPKVEATAVQCLHGGDALTGTTIGDSIEARDNSIGTADTFRVETCPLPPAIYRHRLVITSATPGQVGTLRGRNQIGVPGMGGVIGNLDTEVQRSSESTVPPSFNQWYGFGRGEEVYYRIEGSTSTSAPYAVVLSTTPITPIDLANPLFEGDITISTAGLGHATDTDLWVYNASLEPISGAGNDNRISPASRMSRLVRSLSPGIYYLAISDSNLANDQASPADEGTPTRYVMDFQGVAANSGEIGNLDVAFAISDTFGHLFVVPATKAGPYDIQWFRFAVVPHPDSMHTLCAGDGHPGSAACPCSNNGSSDHGCAGFPNVAGAFLDGTGIPSVQLDSVLLRASDLPHGTMCLFFQGSALVNSGMGTFFNDGLLCAGGTQVRLGVKVSDAMGDAVFGYQQPGDPSVHVAGAIPANGGAFAYQVWYRNNLGSCGFHSNMSNGLVINWGQ